MNTSMMKTNTAMLDRVELNLYDFGILTISRSEYLSLREAIGQHFFRTANHYERNSNYKSILQDLVSGTGYLKYVPESHSCTLSLSLKLNPTRLLWQDFIAKYGLRRRKSLDGNDNFIPHHLQWFWGRELLQRRSFELLADKIQAIVNDFSDCIEANVRNYRRLYSPKVSFKLIEVYWDLYHQSPYSYIELIKPHWMSHFVNPECSQFLCPLPSEQLQKSAQYLTGKSRVKEQSKLYTKTENLVRHEAEFRNYRIRKICGTTVLDSQTIESICAFIEPLISHAIEMFNVINTLEIDGDDESMTFKPLYELARACGQNAFLFDTLIRELKHNRRLASRPDLYAILPRLLRSQEWEREVRGIYRPSPNLLSLIDLLCSD